MARRSLEFLVKVYGLYEILMKNKQTNMSLFHVFSEVTKMNLKCIKGQIKKTRLSTEFTIPVLDFLF